MARTVRVALLVSAAIGASPAVACDMEGGNYRYSPFATLQAEAASQQAATAAVPAPKPEKSGAQTPTVGPQPVDYSAPTPQPLSDEGNADAPSGSESYR